MRSVNFINYLEFSHSGNTFQNALTLGDVNNDGYNELIIGNLNGNLFIYQEKRCVQTIEALGMITAVGVGDILNCGSNVLVVVSGDGWCHIFLCLTYDAESTLEHNDVKLELVHVQRIPANTKVLLIGDIDNDGSFELVLGLTDRVVRSYRWTQNFTGGRLVCLNKWECANQIGNITLHRGSSHLASLLVSQPGGTFMRIRCHSNKDTKGDQMVVDYQPLMSSKTRNSNISSEIIGNLMMENSNLTSCYGGKMYAVATLDGTLMLVKDEEIIWSIQVDHQLFALSKVDVTGSGYEELIACSWQGHTYILNRNKHAVRFQTDEPVSAFCAGLYRIDNKNPPVPCLIYAMFDNKIRVYYDIHFSDITVKNFLHLIKEEDRNGICPSVENLIKNYGNNCKQKKLFNWILYGNHNLR